MNTISIIIPTKDRASLLQNALDSVLSQRTEDFKIEIIVMDDKSEDDIYEKVVAPTIKRINDDMSLNDKIKVVYVYNKDDISGPYPLRNKALKMVTGKYVMFLDDDDEFYDNISVLELYRAVVDKRYAFVYGDSSLFSPEGDEWKLRKTFRMSPYSKRRHIKSKGIIPMGSFIFTLEKDTPMFKEDMVVSADFEWQLRLINMYRFIHIEKMVFKYLRRNDGYHLTAKKDPKIVQQMYKILDDTISKIDLPESEIPDELLFARNWKFCITYSRTLFQPVVDVAQTIAKSLNDCGVQADLRAMYGIHEINQVAASGEYTHILCINPHTYIEQEQNTFISKLTNGTKLLAYNLEQTPITNYNSAWSSMRISQVARYGMFYDYVVCESDSKIKDVENLGFRVIKLDCMYHPNNDFGINHTLDKPYDVMFNGSGNDRREHLLQTLKNEGLVITPNPLPYAFKSDVKADLVSKTKICLNVHYSNMEYFEKPRLFNDLFMNKAVVVSESIQYPEVFKSTEDFYMVKYQNILPVIVTLIKKYNEDTFKLGINAYNKFKENYHYTKVIPEFLKQLKAKGEL